MKTIHFDIIYEVEMLHPAVNNEGKPVDNFEYAASCLDPKIILESLRSGIIKAKIPISIKNGLI